MNKTVGSIREAILSQAARNWANLEIADITRNRTAYEECLIRDRVYTEILADNLDLISGEDADSEDYNLDDHRAVQNIIQHRARERYGAEIERAYAEAQTTAALCASAPGLLRPVPARRLSQY